MDQLPQLYSRLHSSQSALADPEQQPVNISRRNYFRSKSGRSLYVSICNMHQHISQNPDWFEKQLSPAGGFSAPSDLPSKHIPLPAVPPQSPPPKPACSSAPQPERRFDSGLVLNEVLVRTPSLDGVDGLPRRNMLLLLSTGVSGVLPEESSASSSAPCVLQDAPGHTKEGSSTGPEVPPPRDSGIYDSSVPSSELSIPLMEGLSHDQADSSSLADSESSSSGLGKAATLCVFTVFCRNLRCVFRK
ncbi:hypothetical protein GOODEAATRI_001265 [Goodea atripinnis]|uniref:Uncharacterized protein n=1 Tax=Goodea atripinnis TaxID=208336 RepID=A0ABV0N773_9TELE